MLGKLTMCIFEEINTEISKRECIRMRFCDDDIIIPKNTK
jgi:hypothetical protein